MYIEASSPRKPGESAKLVVTVPRNGNPACLSFYYHMYGASAGTLNVYSGNAEIFSVSGNLKNNWLLEERNLYLDGMVREIDAVKHVSCSSFLALLNWRKTAKVSDILSKANY